MSRNIKYNTRQHSQHVRTLALLMLTSTITQVRTVMRYSHSECSMLIHVWWNVNRDLNNLQTMTKSSSTVKIAPFPTFTISSFRPMMPDHRCSTLDSLSCQRTKEWINLDNLHLVLQIRRHTTRTLGQGSRSLWTRGNLIRRWKGFHCGIIFRSGLIVTGSSWRSICCCMGMEDGIRLGMSLTRMVEVFSLNLTKN